MGAFVTGIQHFLLEISSIGNCSDSANWTFGIRFPMPMPIYGRFPSLSGIPNYI